MQIGDTIELKIKASDLGGPYSGSAKVIWISSDGKTVGAQKRGGKRTVFLIPNDE